MKKDLPERSFKFAVSIVNLCKQLQKDKDVSYLVIRQRLKAGTSVVANIEAGVGSQSKADFLTKYSISCKECKECRESKYWLRLIKATEEREIENIDDQIQESSEIIAILTTTIKKLKAKKRVKW